MQMKTKKAEEEAERLRLEAERIRRQQTRINLWMERHDFPSFARKNIEEKMTEKYKENKEANLDNVPTLLSFITSGYKRYARVKICQKMLENVSLQPISLCICMDHNICLWKLHACRCHCLRIWI